MGKPSWRYRRRMIWLTLLLAWGLVGYVALRWEDLAIGSTLALGAFGLMGTIITAYVGGAAWEDVKLHGSEPDDE
jgi:hypothetical protein